MDHCDGSFISRPRDHNFGGKIKSYQPDEINDKNESDVIDLSNSYDMRRYPRGKLVIVNINRISYDSVVFEREGTEKDCEELRQLFLSLGFVVDVVEDVNKNQLLSIMKQESQQSYNHTNALFIAFLTHGHHKFIFASDGKLEIKKITSLFQGSNLAGKPKVFFIQACQGSEHMDSIVPTNTLEVDGSMGLVPRMDLPVEADFLYAYSTVPGFSSWRNKSGSWFIQTLCEVFRKHGRSMDVVRMLTRVNDLLTVRTSYSDDPMHDGKKQVGSIMSQLRKELYLNPPSCMKMISSV